MSALVPVPNITPDIAGRADNQHAWIELLGPAADLANMIAATEFVPQELRNRPAAITAAILYGQEIGIGPMQSLSKVDIVKGRPAPRAELARALALAAGHEVWVDESTNTRVKVSGRRKSSQNVQSVTWSMDDAKKAGLTGNPTYAKYPRQMLLARASAELVRMMCPEVLGGITVFAEEAADLDDGPAPVAAPSGDAPASTVKKRRTAAPAANDAPTGSEATPEPADETPATEGPTQAQTRKAMALFAECGFDDRDDRLQVTSAILGRTVGSWAEVGKAEAVSVIDVLEEIQRGVAHVQVDDGGWQIVREDCQEQDDDVLPLLPDEET